MCLPGPSAQGLHKLVLVAWHGCVPGERMLCCNPQGSSSWKPCVA